VVWDLLHFASVVDDAQNVLWSRASVCLSVRSRMPTLLHVLGCNLGEWQGMPPVVHYWADLQSVHELRCYGNITRMRNVSEYVLVLALCLVIFRVSRRPREMYCGHARLCVCLCVCLSAAACPHYCTDPDVAWGSGRRCPLVVHYWVDLQSVHGLCCYGNTMEMRGRAQR